MSRMKPTRRNRAAASKFTQKPIAFIQLLFFVQTVILLISTTTLSNQDDQSATSSVATEPSPNGPLNSSPSIGKLNTNEALESIRGWSARFGREVHFVIQEVTCLRSIKDHFDPAKNTNEPKRSSIKYNDWPILHSEIVKDIGHTMSWHKTAVEAIANRSEELAGNHTFDSKLRFEYIDVHRLQNIDDNIESNVDEYGLNINPIYPPSNELDQPSVADANGTAATSLPDEPQGVNQEIGQFDSDGQLTSGTEQQTPEPLPTPSKLDQQPTTTNQPSSSSMVGGELSQPQAEWQTPVRFMKLMKHQNFADVLINADESAVHIPVHIFPGDPHVINGIAWSDELTKVFRDNFKRNPKLTNQYFASQTGFLRLFPAQKWPIPRTDPDLYDARMRPWYVAGASSRKDVVILVDSSGSMTGSRRDIAKGVVFEILDTLTDNDHFLILKFSETVQQVGVPQCLKMRIESGSKKPSIPLKNTLFNAPLQQDPSTRNPNDTDIDSLFLLPATGRNIRHIKSNFTIPTAGIANFSHALVTAFEVLRNYQDSSQQLGSQCNQAIMLITDGSPSDFQDIFKLYNVHNAPVRIFTYLIGREAGDVTHTKMMACHNRGYYTHVINLAEVRETVQQYIPVMARPLVLNGTHPITWTPAYGDLTYQILTDWIWESRRRDKARAILAASGRGSAGSTSLAGVGVTGIRVTNDDVGSVYSSSDHDNEEAASYDSTLEEELDALDLFGYNTNPDCFWQTNRNDLLTTVVQPVYDRKNESVIIEKFLVKNVWTIKETVMRTANILGVAAADMKINDIVGSAPSHKLGPNGYAIMLTNNGYAMHHPDLRSILEPFSMEPSKKNLRILKPFFSSLDLTQVEHILNPADDKDFLNLRKEAVSGLTGWRKLSTKRTLDCQKRAQTRKQIFYYKAISQFPFSFMISIPEPYGSHRVEAQIEIKSFNLSEKLTTYFTTSDYDLWTVHPDYQYCDGPSNNTITTLLDMFQRIEAGKLDDIQWPAVESSRPPVFFPSKIVCDKDLVQSLVYDAVATFGFSESCGSPSPSAESNLLGMFGVRFSFVATRSGLTRVRHFDADDSTIKKEALAFAKKHARAVDETFYSRTVDYNMLVDNSSTLLQVPFNIHEKIHDRLERYILNQAINLDDSLADNSLPPSSSASAPSDTSLPSNAIDPLTGEPIRLNIKDMSLLEKLDILTNSSIHVIATQSIVVNEGEQRAVAGVAGVFYDYASFVQRFLNLTNNKFQPDRTSATKSAACYTSNSFQDENCDELNQSTIKCGLANDTIDCLLIDNNGYIVVSEDLDFIGRHLKAYDPKIMNRLVDVGVFHEINITDYQSVCLKLEEKQQSSNALSSTLVRTSALAFVNNLISIVSYSWTILITLISLFADQAASTRFSGSFMVGQPNKQQHQPLMSLLPNKTYLRPCERILTLYETRPGKLESNLAEQYTTRCGCEAWFIYEQVTKTNLIMLVLDSSTACRLNCDQAAQSVDPTDPLDAKQINKTAEDQVCSMLERESQLYRKKLDSCISHHQDEDHIKLCGAAAKSSPVSYLIMLTMIFISSSFLFTLI